MEKAPIKRKSVQLGSSSLYPTKCPKIEPDDGEWEPSARQEDLEQPGTSSGNCPVGNGGSIWKAEDTEVICEHWFPVSSSGSSDTGRLQPLGVLKSSGWPFLDPPLMAR